MRKIVLRVRRANVRGVGWLVCGEKERKGLKEKKKGLSVIERKKKKGFEAIPQCRRNDATMNPSFHIAEQILHNNEIYIYIYYF